MLLFPQGSKNMVLCGVQLKGIIRTTLGHPPILTQLRQRTSNMVLMFFALGADNLALMI